MPRVLKALSLALAIVGLSILSIVGASCGSNNAQYRIVDTIAGLPFFLDIDVNVTNPSATSPTYANVTWQNVEPGSGKYQSIGTGSDPIEVFQTGTTTQYIASTNLNLGSGQFTVLLLANGPGVTGPTIQKLTDNNTAPTSGNGEFRVVNASPNSPGGTVDVYILQAGTQFPNPGITPDVSGLTYGQPSGYVTKTTGSGNQGYQLWVTPHMNQTPYIQGFSLFLSAGQISTIVLTDTQAGGILNQTPVVLTDLK